MQTVDFKIVAISQTPGVALIYPQNEDAYIYLTDEADMNTFQDGSAPIEHSRVGDFISDCGWDHFACELK